MIDGEQLTLDMLLDGTLDHIEEQNRSLEALREEVARLEENLDRLSRVGQTHILTNVKPISRKKHTP